MPAPRLVKLTTYAELLERSAATAFDEEFAEDGSFTSKMVKGRRYWYFQTSGSQGRVQKYVGPETPELMKRIARQRDARNDERERRALVATLVRSFGVPRPIQPVGEILSALSQAGVFRLRGVLVGTMAYQTYPATLGLALPGAALQTNDVDIAQFLNVSVAVDDRTPAMLEVLQAVDKTFRPVPGDFATERHTSYVGKGGLRVDFLTPNQGRESDSPRHLPALQTYAQPLRFLDFLIADPQPAVVLYGAGVPVQVPAPERYAIHKLIISRRRSLGQAKSDKDTQQAQALLTALVEKRPEELKAAWHEAMDRGPSWRQYVGEGLRCVKPAVRDLTLKAVEAPRSVIPGLDLQFSDSAPKYDADREVVFFDAAAAGAAVRCAISREALEDHFAAADREPRERVAAVVKNRSEIERLMRTKYLSSPVEQTGAVLLTTTDVERLRKVRPKRGSRSPR
jgi:hypothetical protein